MKGDVAVLIATAKFSEAGLISLKPTCEAVPFDLVIYHKSVFYRVQIKRARKDKNRGIHTGRWYVPFRKVSPTGDGHTIYKYGVQHADFICGVVVETNDVYCFPLKGNRIQSMVIVDPEETGRQNLRGGTKLDTTKFRNIIHLGDSIITI